MIIKILLIAFIGSLLCLDRILIQIMVSRPIIIASLTGLILGNPYAGLIIGAILELFWIDRIPIGIYIPPNDSIVAVVATSAAILATQSQTDVKPDMIALAVLMAIPFGILAKKLDVRIMDANNKLSDQALDDAKKLDIHAIEKKTYMGIARVFAVYFIFILIAQIILISLFTWMYPHLPDPVISMLKMTYYFLPLLGIAVALNTIKLRGAIPVFCAIFLAIATVLEFLHVF